MATVTPKLITAEQFARLPEPKDGSKQELVRGVVVTMPPPRFRHGKYQLRIGTLLDQHVRPNRLGQVVTETGLITRRRPDSVRAPDVAFWSVERLPLDQEPDTYPDVAADLCAEILSPDDTQASIAIKVREYFACGVRIVWAVDPRNRTIAVYRPKKKAKLLKESAILSGEDVVPGFSCRVAEVFE